MFPVCNVCGDILIIDKNWTQHRMEVSDYRCRDDCDWHHVTKDLVVVVPRSVHRKVRHKLGDGNIIEGLIG